MEGSTIDSIDKMMATHSPIQHRPLGFTSSPTNRYNKYYSTNFTKPFHFSPSKIMGNKANKKTYGKAKGKIARNSGNGNAAYNSSPQKHAIKAQELSKVTKSKSTEPKRSRRELEALAAGLERDKRRNAEALENNTAKTGLVKAFNEEYMPVLTTAPAMKKRAREDDDEQLEMIVMAKRQKLVRHSQKIGVVS